MMPMPDGVRLATDIYRPKNATGKVPIDLGADAVQLQLLGHPERRAGRHERAADRGQARLRLRRAERARALLLRRQLRHPRIEDRRLQHRRLADEAAVVERQDRHDRLLVDRRVPDGRRGARPSRLRRDERAGLRRRRRPRRSVLRAGQLVSRRRGADAVHRLALRRAEPGAADVSAEHVAAGSDSRVEVVRSRQHAPPVDWSKALWHLPTQDIIKNVDGPRGIFEIGDAGRDRRQDDPARAERSGVVPRRPLSRRSEAERARPVVHVVVRRLGRAEPRALQPRARDARRRRSPTSSGRSSRRSRTAPTRARPPTPSSASAAWATRASTTTRSSTASSIASSRARRRRGSTRCRRSPTSRWASTSGRRRTPGRRPARSR